MANQFVWVDIPVLDLERAIRFYERNGFATAGTRTFQVGSQQCCDLILAKAL